MTPTDRDALLVEIEQLINDSADTDIIMSRVRALASPSPAQTETLCEDCPPVGYPTDKTRCLPCPRRNPSPAQWPEDVVERAKAAYYEALEKTHGVVMADDYDIERAMRAALATLPPPEDERVKGLVVALTNIDGICEAAVNPQLCARFMLDIQRKARSPLASYRGGA